MLMGWVRSGGHSYSPFFLFTSPLRPTPSRDEVAALPHGKVSVPKEAWAVGRCTVEKSRYRGRRAEGGTKVSRLTEC